MKPTITLFTTLLLVPLVALQAAEVVGEVAREAAALDCDGDFLAAHREAKVIAGRARDGKLVAQAGLLRELVGPRAVEA